MNPVVNIRRRLGRDAVLLAIAKNGKAPILDGWQKLTAADMTPAYLDGLNHGGNIGVSLGQPSNGLCTIDLDLDEAIEPFLALNPGLRSALRTKRVRGGNIWVRCPDHPGSSAIKDKDGNKVGEWRATGNQTVVHGQAIDPKKAESTPTKYRIVSGDRPAELRAFADLIWPDGWRLPAHAQPREPDGFAALKQRCGDPFFVVEKRLELNEVFWAGLYAMEHHCVWEPSEREFFEYDAAAGIYRPKTSDAMKREIGERLLKASREMNQPWLAAQRSDRKLNSIVAHLRGLIEERDAFKCKGSIVALGNGLLDIGGGGIFTEFSPAAKLRNKSPISFDKRAQCSRFLDELITPAVHPEDELLIQKYAGLSLLGDNLIQRMLILDGEAELGKTQLANVIQAIVGRENVSELRTKFLGERFETYRFLRKTLLIGVDVEPTFLSTKGASVLKGLVGGDWFDCERKGGVDSFPMQGKFCAIVTSNTRLRVRLQGDVGAWRRRLLIVRYEAPPPRKKIPDFGQLLVREEGSGILNWCLQGLAALLSDVETQGDIARTERQRSVVDSLLAESDSLRVFLHDRMKRCDDTDVSVQEIVESYAAFCPERGWRALHITEIQASLDSLMLEIFQVTKAHSIQRDKRSVRGFRGVALC